MKIKKHAALIRDNLIAKHYAGSHAYGTQLSTSDVDFRGIFVGDPINIRTPFFTIKEAKDTTEEDTVIYELSQFMALALNCNPNIVETLWVDDADIVFDTPAYKLLRTQAPNLLSSKIAFTTAGYAAAQLRRLTQSKKKVNFLPDLRTLCGLLRQAASSLLINEQFILTECGEEVYQFMIDNKYITILNNKGVNKLTSLSQLYHHFKVPPTEAQRMSVVCKPQHKTFVSMVQWFGTDKLLHRDFHIEQFKTDHRLIPYGKHTYGVYPMKGYNLYDNMGMLNNTYLESNRTDLGTPLFIIKFNSEEFARANNEYHKFWEWRNNRNPTRLAMEEKFDFDGKHAMHLVRLLRMGEEVLQTGKLQIKRPDAKELLAIRNGEWTYDEILKYATEKDEYIRTVLYKQTQLPKKPNFPLAAKLIMEIQDMVWNNGN